MKPTGEAPRIPAREALRILEDSLAYFTPGPRLVVSKPSEGGDYLPYRTAA